MCFSDGNTTFTNHYLKYSNKYSIDNFVKNLVIDPISNKYYDTPNLDYVITSRVDDDDLVENDFVKNIQLNACPNVDTFVFYGSNTGFVIEDNKVYLTKLNHPGAHSIGLSLIQKTNTIFKQYFTVWCCSHNIYKTNIGKLNCLISDKRFFKHGIDKSKMFMDDMFYWIYNRQLSTSKFALKPYNEITVDYKTKFNLDI